MAPNSRIFMINGSIRYRLRPLVVNTVWIAPNTEATPAGNVKIDVVREKLMTHLLIVLFWLADKWYHISGNPILLFPACQLTIIFGKVKNLCNFAIRSRDLLYREPFFS